MQKWITLPFGPRKKERRRERKKEGHNERPVGRSAGRCRRLLLRAHNGHKGARSLACFTPSSLSEGRTRRGRLLKGKLFGENPSSRRQSCSYPSSVAPAPAKMAPRDPASKDEVTGPLPLALDVGISRSAVAKAVAGGRRPGHLQSHPLTP